MELHSYAKHRTAKKWSVEQKRRLVKARISCDDIFKTKPNTSLVPWKSVIFHAKLDDFSIVFVRKQWANMIAKYMQYKKAGLGNKPTHDIDAKTVEKITQEWEFFEPIHRFMTRKTANLHSYAALPTQETQNQKAIKNVKLSNQNRPQNSASSNERLNACSSDTNDAIFVPNTDHDFYSKRAAQQHYFADIEEDTLESIKTDMVMIIDNDTDEKDAQEYISNNSHIANQEIVEHVVESVEQQGGDEKSNVGKSKLVTKKKSTLTKLEYEQQQYYFADIEEDTLESIKTETVMTMNDDTAEQDAQEFILNNSQIANQEIVEHVDIAVEQSGDEKPNAEKLKLVAKKKQKPTLTKLEYERIKYYRHKRRFHHRMEQRVDAMLNVIGQIAKVAYPTVDISPILQISNEVNNIAGTNASSSSSSSENENES